MNCANVDFDACPDARERPSDLGQIVHAAEAATGASRQVAPALLEPSKSLARDRHADPDAGSALLDLQVEELGGIG